MFSIQGPIRRLLDGPEGFRREADGGVSKQADTLLRIPLCAGTLLRAADLPTVSRSHTALSHFLASSSSIHFPFFLVDSYSFLSHLAKSAYTDFGRVLWSAILFFCLGGEFSRTCFDDDLKWSLQIGLFWIDFISLCCSLKEAVQSWWEGQQMARVQPESIVGETIKTS